MLVSVLNLKTPVLSVFQLMTVAVLSVIVRVSRLYIMKTKQLELEMEISVFRRMKLLEIN